MDTPDGKGALNYSIREPHGVIGVISPWNFPLLLSTWKIAPAMATGNAVVFKPSEETPTTATLLAEVMAEAGVPAGAFNLVHGFGPDSAGEFIVKHKGVNAITFTGESRTGAEIMKNCAEQIKPVSFELGGKNPAIIFADCDFNAALEGTVRSVFANTGQVCLASERVYVERPIFDKFVSALKAKAEGMKIGRPEDKDTQMGPLISRGHRDKVISYYRLAKEEGLFCGVSSGSNVAGAIKLARAHPELKMIVTLICDTGQRYFSTELCGNPKHVDIPEREHPMDPYTTRQLDRYQKRWEIIE